MQRLEVSGAVRPLYGSLGVKGLKADAVSVMGRCRLICSMKWLVKRKIVALQLIWNGG
jgi:hypothetical protein